MAYPGDQQQPGGWPPRQPPQSPYGPADDQAAHGGSLFDPLPGRPRGSAAPGSFGGPDSYDQGSPSGTEQGGYGGGPGSSDGPGSFGGHPDDAGRYGGPGRFGGYGDANGYDEPGENGYGAADGYNETGGFADPGGYGAPGAYGPDRFAAEPGGYPGTPDGPGGPGDGCGSRASGRKSLIIGAAVAVGVVVAGGVALATMTGGGGGKPKATPAASRAAAPRSTPTPASTPTETGRGNLLASRATDPEPLTLNEVFKNKKFRGGGRTYVMMARRSLRTCSGGVHGTGFRRTLGKAGCTQVLRATFSNGKLVGTIGVLNLRTERGAAAAERASRPKDSYVLPLPGAGTTKKIGQGLSLTTAETDGHYLILSWVQYPSGKKIAKGDYAAVTSFVKYTTLGSNLRPALNYRSMDGKPA